MIIYEHAPFHVTDFGQQHRADHKPDEIPRTHKICDIKNFWTKFCPNLTILVSLESWRRDLFKFGKTKLNRNHKFAKIENLGLGLRIKIWI